MEPNSLIIILLLYIGFGAVIVPLFFLTIGSVRDKDYTSTIIIGVLLGMFSSLWLLTLLIIFREMKI